MGGRHPSDGHRPPHRRPDLHHPRPLPRPRRGDRPYDHGRGPLRRRLAAGWTRRTRPPGHPLEPPAGDFDRARSALLAADLPSLRPRHNHLTDPDRGIQLRFGHDHRWYPYEAEPGTDDWWPTGPADPDPVGALTALLAR